jgi:hypothetical protein
MTVQTLSKVDWAKLFLYAFGLVNGLNALLPTLHFAPNVLTEYSGILSIVSFTLGFTINTFFNPTPPPGYSSVVAPNEKAAPLPTLPSVPKAS